ncbi:CobW family GTP-binding protein [Leptothoe spongobia]|uniref:GTP-binding protein n=1 Tax=Leptothoe spongobia TAU-MAC 1115 TaxID=1967444 RepID=A0A947DFJ2_9CYAN|nr:GTP-binding protein [Leptothoe spongobia]MBT9316162.1 GTP-binding protein [Leptothoe spongobia TAU-MAC 1115]
MTAVISAPPKQMDDSKHGLPVTIITGFLGSGKTTLLNHILTNQDGLKTAVLVNEFGEVGIDNDLLITTGDDTMVELSNGCICCTINNDLLEAVYKVLERRDKIDYLVVETTGLADPLPVALTFLGTELRDLTRLDSIVTLVDSENYSVDLFNSQAAHNQIAYGDIILLNKTDLVDEGDVDLLELKVRDIKEGARILRTTQSQVPLPLILSVGLFESDKYFEPTQKDAHAQNHDDHSNCDHDHGHCEHDHDDEHGEHAHHHDKHSHQDHSNCDHDHGHCEHDHDHEHHHSHLDVDGFTSISIARDQPLAIRKFQHFLDNKLPDNVFRAKGILWFDESEKRHIFHLSGKRFSLEDEEWNGRPHKTQLVLIGQNLDHDDLEAEIEKCFCLESQSRGRGFGS